MFDLTKKENDVLNFFLDRPTEEFYIREIAKKLKMSTSTAKLSVDKLKKLDLIIEKITPPIFHKTKQKAIIRIFKANIDNKLVQERKRMWNIHMISESGTIDRIQNPISIVLFGSFAKGMNNKKSDIDLLIITNDKKPVHMLDIKGHELQIIQLTPLEWKEKVKKDKPFYQEIITTGIPLIGELPL